MIFWVFAAGFTFVTVIALLWPILKGTSAEDDTAAFGLQVYKDQLTELETDHLLGRISSENLTAARIEVQRRMLRAARETELKTAASPKKPEATLNTIATVLIAFIIPAGALTIYINLGQPNLPNLPYNKRSEERAQLEQSSKVKNLPKANGTDVAHDKIVEMLTRLKNKLIENPSDRKSWILLGRSYLRLQDYSKAADALRRALALSQDDPNTMAIYAESLTMSSAGVVTPEAKSIFQKVLARLPKEPRSRFYLGLADYQNNEFQNAINRWIALEIDTPQGAGWEKMLKTHINKAAMELGIDVTEARLAAMARLPKSSIAEILPNASNPKAPRLNAQQLANAQQMRPEERSKMIRAMVNRLANRLKKEPNNIDGWMRLGRSYQVLNQMNESKKAYAKAAALAPNQIDVQMAYARTLFPKGTPESDIPTAFKKIIKRVLNVNPDMPEAMFYGGMIALNDGDKTTAHSLWSKLLSKMGPNAPIRLNLEQRLKSLHP